MKFYIAAKWQSKEEIREIYKKIQDRGHEVKEDWTSHPSLKPYGENPEQSRRYAKLDLDAVRKSDVFVLLTNEDGIGMFVEFGGAIASYILTGKPAVYVIGKQLERSMFYFHPDVKRRKTIEEVLDEVGA